MARTAAYIRVATPEEDHNLQVREITEYAKRARLGRVQNYTDLGVSCIAERRPQLEQLMEHVRDRRYDTVLVWKLGRFARSLDHLVQALEEFERLGVRFISVTEQLDTKGSKGRTILPIIGAITQLERDLISERVTAGMKAARARGVPVGRPPTPSTLTQRVRELARTTNLSVRQIAEETGVSKSVAGRIVKEVRSSSASSETSG